MDINIEPFWIGASKKGFVGVDPLCEEAFIFRDLRSVGRGIVERILRARLYEPRRAIGSMR